MRGDWFRRLGLSTLTVLCAVSSVGRAAAEPAAPAPACSAGKSALAATPAAEFELANCAVKARQFAHAWQLFSRVAANPGSPAPLAQLARTQATNLKPRIAELKLIAAAASPSGLELRIDGLRAALGRSLFVDAGFHEISVAAPDYETREYVVRLREGEVLALPVNAGKPLSSRATWGWISAGMGIAGLTVGAVAGFTALEFKGKAEDRCSPTLKLCDPVGDYATRAGRAYRFVSNAGWVVGGLGMGAAFVLLTSDDASPSTPRLSARLGAGQAALAGVW